MTTSAAVKEKPVSGLDRLISLVAPELEQVNAELLEKAESQVQIAAEVGEHILKAGGKRIRPVLTLVAAKMCGYMSDQPSRLDGDWSEATACRGGLGENPPMRDKSGKRHINLASSVELIHTATLLHDDVVDESKLRRGDSTANSIWGNKPSVLVGDFLLSRSFRLMVEDGDLRVLDALSEAATVIIEGEIMQLSTARNLATTVEEYLNVIGAKTARLFSAACEVGALLCGNETQVNALLEVGRNLGIAFQVVDDALDYSAREARFGKNVGNDFQEGKLTLPIIIAFKKSDDKEKQFWTRTIENGQIENGDLEAAIEIMEKYDVMNETIQFAESYCEKARKALKTFPASTYKDALLETLNFCVERAY